MDPRKTIAALISWVAITGPAWAQDASPTRYTLESAVETALWNYPGLSAAQARVRAAEAGIELANAAFLPQASLHVQANRATDNNTTGLLFPQGTIPPLSGPVSDATSATSYWGSAAGVLVSWDVWDFGARQSRTRQAQASQTEAQEALGQTRLDVAYRAADAYFAAVAAGAVVRANEANLARTRALSTSVKTLVQNGLRPGADLSRVDAEDATARINVIQAREREAVARNQLARQLGVVAPVIVSDATRYAASGASPWRPGQAEAHPAARLASASVALAEAEREAVARSANPRLTLLGAAFGRGSGAGPGTALGDGLAPNRFNAAAGVAVSVPLLEGAPLAANLRSREASISAEQARLQEVVQGLGEATANADAAYQAAQAASQETPRLLQAARSRALQIETRYKAGLATMVDVADAQRLLTQAEIDDALAGVRVWRSLLQRAYAQGDLTPFLRSLPASQGESR